jgi:hypothetical protein
MTRDMVDAAREVIAIVADRVRCTAWSTCGP